MAHLLVSRCAHTRLPLLWRSSSGLWRAVHHPGNAACCSAQSAPLVEGSESDAWGPLCPPVPLLQGNVFTTV